MPTITPIPQPTGTRTAGLVSVDGRTYPLESVRIEARAEGGVAVSTLTQTYRNPYDEPLEVLYTLPLPADGAVVGYAIHLGERVIRGEVQKREEARKEYRRALLEGRTAGLLEQDRADTFRQQLGCLPAGQTARVEIEVVQPLGFLPATDERSPSWEYRFPTVVGVRYEGAPGRVPDAARLDVDRAGGDGAPVRIDCGMVVADGGPDALELHSPSHDLRCETDDAGARVSLKEDARLDRDLVIRWNAAEERIGLRLAEGSGLSGDEGRYGLLTLTPPRLPEQPFVRDLTLLIDASGSMHGEPIRRAKSIAAELVRSLDAEDRFEILAFSTGVRRLTSGMVAARSRTVEAALRALTGLEAGGGTEMTGAVYEALRPLRPDSQRQVVLLTDGYIGFEGEVIGRVMNELPPGARLHAAGIGSTPNRSLTRGVARAGHGVEVFVGDDRAVDEATRQLLQATVRPVLTDLTIEGTALRAIAPERPRDVLAGRPLVLAAELAPEGGSLLVRGKVAGSSEPWEHQVQVPPLRKGSECGSDPDAAVRRTPFPVGALYGREAIEDRELQLSSAGESRAAIQHRIESLGLRHRIASRMTSLVAIAEEPSVDPNEPRRRERLAVELPADVSAEGTGLIASTRGVAFDFMEARVGAVIDEATEMFEIARDRVDLTLGSPRSPFDALGTAPVHISDARVLDVDGPRLTLEFAVPFDRFRLPDDSVLVEFPESGTGTTAEVVPSESSPRGPHPHGLIVRLTLELGGEACWHHTEVIVRWQAALGDRGRKRLPVEMPLVIPPDLLRGEGTS